MSFSGLGGLCQELEVDYSSYAVKDLCVASTDDHNDLKVLCFTSASSLDSILESFDTLDKVHANDIFGRMWRDRMRELSQSKIVLRIEDIRSKIWEPTFQACKDLLDELYNRSIALKKVDTVFRHFKDTPERMETHLVQLAQGVNQCLALQKDTLWVTSVVTTIKEYWCICQYGIAADVLLELQDNLQLTGDFELVNVLSEQVRILCCDTSIC